MGNKIKEKKGIVHFRVDPSILKIIRSAYWYEEREKWALSVLESFEGLSIAVAMYLLKGNAILITNDNGKTLSAVYKEDKKFKKELKDFQKFKEEETERKKEEGRCEITEKRVDDTIEVLGINKDEVLLDIESVESRKIWNKEFAMAIHQKNLLEKDSEKQRVNKALITEFMGKEYEFVFKGHHYTYKDNARNQRACPHCGEGSKGSIWSHRDDKEAYIGKKKMKTGYVICFECPKCFEKFYYHRQLVY